MSSAASTRPSLSSLPAAPLTLWQQFELKAALRQAMPELIGLRRHIHAHPELSGAEHQTAALVAGELRLLGWEVREGVGRTGVVAELGPAAAPLVALRVDMDALPVEERTGLPFASCHQGLMHACGHDLHTAIGLGVARLLAPLAHRLTARVVSGLQEAISRRLDALQPVVVSFGKIEGGKAFNVIADHVRLLGTVRCLDTEVHAELPGWIEDTVHAICRGYGGEARVRYRCISPPVHNDPALTELVEEAALALLDRPQVRRLEQPSLGAEDFAELLTAAPGTMFRLGVAGAEGCPPLHNGGFNPDEGAIAVGVQVLTLSLLLWMERRV